MRVHEGGVTASEDADARAWGLVADGYDAALKVTSLSDEGRAWLLEQRRDALLLAGRPLLAAAAFA